MAIRVFKQEVYLPLLLLAALEAAVVILLILGFTLYFAPPGVNISPVAAPFRALAVALVVTLSILSMGLYQPQQRLKFDGIVLRLLVALAGATAVLAVLYYFFPWLTLGRKVLFTTSLLAFVLFVGVRWIFAKLVPDGVYKKRVLVYGAGRRAEKILSLRRRADRRGFVVAGYISDDGNSSPGFSGELVERPNSLLEYAIEHNIDEIVVAMENRRKNFPQMELLDCRVYGVNVVNLNYFLERETGKIDIELLRTSWLIFSPDVTKTGMYRAGKRIFDTLVALVLLVVTLPITLIAAIAIRLESSGGDPIFYRQTRVGYRGVNFSLIKFRSMRIDAEQDGQPKWADKNDSRITRTGEVLRRYRIDELPQLINILLGHMSLVGPRPERPEFVDDLRETIPYYRERHCAVPGLAGWAQLLYPYGGNEAEAAEKLQYDLYYVIHRSMLFDIMILLQTVEVVLWNKGAR